MSEIKGCMNCGNISCENNKQRRVDGCGRWKSPEQKIIELEGDRSKREKAIIELSREFNRRIIEYEKRIAELKAENAQLRESFHDYREQVKNDNESIKEWKEKALKIMRDISACELMKVITKAKQYTALDNLENFLREIPEDSKC